MSKPIRVPEIGLRIGPKAWQGVEGKGSRPLSSFRAFVCAKDNLERFFPDRPEATPDDKEAHRLAEQYFSRIWPSGQPGTAVISNISMQENEPATYLFRPQAEGAFTAGYGSDMGLPAFRCKLRDGFFLAIGFEVNPYFHGPGPDDLVLTGPVYSQKPTPPGEAFVPTPPPRALPENVITKLLALRSRRLQVARHVESWQQFLQWQMKLVTQRQIGLRYRSFEIDDTASRVTFHVSAPVSELRRFRKSRSFPAMAMPLSASRNPKRWEPVEKARGIKIGEIIPGKALTDKLPKENSKQEQTIRECVIEFPVDFDDSQAFVSKIPEEGFLCSAVFMDIVPLTRQQFALRKLTVGAHANPALADFLFDASQASQPEVPIVLQTDPDQCEDTLNEAQRLAVSKALASRDLFLLQGPPGTGKTTVIVDICQQAARQGQRVLVASQANVAVENVLNRLASDPTIRPLRIGGQQSNQAESEFLEQNVVSHWLASIRTVTETDYQQGQSIEQTRRQLDETWNHLETLDREQRRLAQKHAALSEELKKVEGHISQQSAGLATINKQLKSQRTVVDQLEVSRLRLSKGHPAADAGQWVQNIDSSTRAELFLAVSSWQTQHPISPIPILTTQGWNKYSCADDNKQNVQSNPWRRFWRFLLGTPQTQPPVVSPPIEPNWAVEWIEANRFLGHLISFQQAAPDILQTCEELERLCVVSAPTESDWAKATGALQKTLSIPAVKILAEWLRLSQIAASLKPRSSYHKLLAAARNVLSQSLENAGSFSSGLAGALCNTASASHKYLNQVLSRTSQEVRKRQTKLAKTQGEEKQLRANLADIHAKLQQLESDWQDVIDSLPPAVVELLGEDGRRYGPEALKQLEEARTAYMNSTDADAQRHDLWGTLHAEWLRLLHKPGSIDQERLIPLYKKRCNIVGATCSYCGSGKHFTSREELAQFDIVIVDEVSKATPPELLLPALVGSTLMLIGDHRQLPPTFREGPKTERPFEEMAEVDEEFEQISRFREMVTSSLYKKLYEEAPETLKQVLTVQHRMHPQIMEVINQFYDNQLQCGINDPDTKCRHNLTIQTRYGDLLLPDNHVLWIDTSRDQRGQPSWERQVGTSKANDLEAKGVARMVQLLNEAIRQSSDKPAPMDLGIITFYGPQIRHIRNQLNKLPGKAKDLLDIQLNTVDGFQGAECSIIIVSLVRSKRGSIGDFARKFERINVAMSRAKKLLIILGARETFVNLNVELPTEDGSIQTRRCYSHILDVVRRHGGLRTVRDLF